MATLRNIIHNIARKQVFASRLQLRSNPAVCFATQGDSTSSTSTPGNPPPPPPSQPESSQTGSKDDNKTYQAMEYYQHNEFSYYDIDNEMVSSRLPQPSKYKKVVPAEEPPKK